MKYLLVEFGVKELPVWVNNLIDAGLEMSWERVRLGSGGCLKFIRSPFEASLFGEKHFTVRYDEE